MGLGSGTVAALALRPTAPQRPGKHGLPPDPPGTQSPEFSRSLLPAEIQKLAGESDAPTPAWPWFDASATPAGRLLASKKVSLDFAQTPLAEALAQISSSTGVPVTLDRKAAAFAGQEELKVNLRTKEIDGWPALALVASTSDRLVATVGASGAVTIALAADVPWERVCSGSAPLGFASALLERGPDAGAATRRGLTGQRVTAFFQNSPLEDAVNWLQDTTGLNVMVEKDIDTAWVKVTATVQNESPAELLDQLTSSARLTWRVDDDVVVIASERPKPPPALADRRVRLPLGPGSTVRELVDALETVDVPVVASPETWASRGTFSFEGPETRVGDLVAEIASRTGLQAWIGHVGVHESIALTGTLWGVADAYSADPYPYPGIVAEIADLRARLPGEIANRARARDTNGVDLLETEKAAARTIARIVELARRSRGVVDAADRCTKMERGRLEIEKELAAADEVYARARIDSAIQVEDLEERAVRAHEDRAQLETRRVVARETLRGELEKTAPGSPERRQLESQSREEERRFDAELRELNERDPALGVQTARLVKQNPTAAARDEVANQRRRLAALDRDYQVARTDLSLRTYLERGMTLSQAAEAVTAH